VPAALDPITGADKIAAFIVDLARKFRVETTVMDINGEPGLILRANGEIFGALTVETDGRRITAIYAVRNPDKLLRFLSGLMSIAGVRSCPPSRSQL
jgi:RNA polymerase sigma-70 factor, ECF subfamily